MADYKLFSGCVIQNRLPFLEASAKFVFDKVGVGVSEAEFSCCPNPVGLKPFNTMAWYSMAARNLVLAEKENKAIMSLCNGCYQSLNTANVELHHDPVLKKNVNDVLAKVGKELKGTAEVKHFIKVLHDEVGIAKIKSLVTKPLTGLKVAVHVGCHYARPSHIANTEDPLKPVYLKELVEALGATVVPYDNELLCCGNSVRSTDEKVANSILKAKIDEVIMRGADCLVVNCPACFTQFDSEQGKLKEEGKTYKFPTYFITELMAMAMGKDPKDIGIAFHRSKGAEALAKVGLQI